MCIRDRVSFREISRLQNYPGTPFGCLQNVYFRCQKVHIALCGALCGMPNSFAGRFFRCRASGCGNLLRGLSAHCPTNLLCGFCAFCGRMLVRWSGSGLICRVREMYSADDCSCRRKGIVQDAGRAGEWERKKGRERGRGREEKRKRGREEERKRGGRLDTGGPCFWRCKI